MRIWLILLCLCVCEVATADEKQAAASDAGIEVMSFNLRYASDRKPNSWAERRQATVELIRGHRPDVIGTQEGLYHQLRDLERELPGYRFIGQGRRGGSHGEFMAVFYRPERLDPREYDHFWLSDTPLQIGSRSFDADLPRMLTWIRFQDRRSGKSFFLFNTHFDHQSQNAREKSARLLLDHVDRLESDLPLILTGDFNAAAGKNRVHAMLTGKFTDTWITIHGSEQNPDTFHGFSGQESGRGRIDWILTRGAISCSATRILRDSLDGQFPSDHYPVSATLRLD